MWCVPIRRQLRAIWQEVAHVEDILCTDACLCSIPSAAQQILPCTVLPAKWRDSALAISPSFAAALGKHEAILMYCSILPLFALALLPRQIAAQIILLAALPMHGKIGRAHV